MQTELTDRHDITAAHPFPEGKIANAIESKTAKLPSELFLLAAGGSIAAALALKISGRDRDALFVGQWAAPFLLLGIYNKMVKMFGTDPHQNP
ncbi:MAG: hypothetical protein ABIP71_00750 [Verrucomicrobiota bacterium]